MRTGWCLILPTPVHLDGIYLLPVKTLVGAWSMSWLPVSSWHLASISRCVFFQQCQNCLGGGLKGVWFSFGKWRDYAFITLCYPSAPEPPDSIVCSSVSHQNSSIILYLKLFFHSVQTLVKKARRLLVFTWSMGWGGGWRRNTILASLSQFSFSFLSCRVLSLQQLSSCN